MSFVIFIAHHTFPIFPILLLFFATLHGQSIKKRWRDLQAPWFTETVFPPIYLSLGLLFTFANLAAAGWTMGQSNNAAEQTLELILNKFKISLWGITCFIVGSMLNAFVAMRTRSRAATATQDRNDRLGEAILQQADLCGQMTQTMTSMDQTMKQAFAGDDHGGVPTVIQNLADEVGKNNANLIEGLKQVFSEVTGVRAFREGVTQTLVELRSTVAVLNQSAVSLSETMDGIKGSVENTTRRLKVASDNMANSAEDMKNAFDQDHGRLEAILQTLEGTLSRTIASAIQETLQNTLRDNVVPGIVDVLQQPLAEVDAGLKSLQNVTDHMHEAVQNALAKSLAQNQKVITGLTQNLGFALEGIPEVVATHVAKALEPFVATMADAQERVTRLMTTQEHSATLHQEALAGQAEQAHKAAAEIASAMVRLPIDIQASVGGLLKILPEAIGEAVRPAFERLQGIGASAEALATKLEAGAAAMGEAGGQFQDATAQLAPALGRIVEESLAKLTANTTEVLRNQIASHRSQVDRNLLEAANHSNKVLDELPGKLRKAVESGATGVSSQLRMSMDYLAQEAGTALTTALQPMLDAQARSIQDATQALLDAVSFRPVTGFTRAPAFREDLDSEPVGVQAL